MTFLIWTIESGVDGQNATQTEKAMPKVGYNASLTGSSVLLVLTSTSLHDPLAHALCD